MKRNVWLLTLALVGLSACAALAQEPMPPESELTPTDRLMEKLIERGVDMEEFQARLESGDAVGLKLRAAMQARGIEVNEVRRRVAIYRNVDREALRQKLDEADLNPKQKIALLRASDVSLRELKAAQIVRSSRAAGNSPAETRQLLAEQRSQMRDAIRERVSESDLRERIENSDLTPQQRRAVMRNLRRRAGR